MECSLKQWWTVIGGTWIEQATKPTSDFEPFPFKTVYIRKTGLSYPLALGESAPKLGVDWIGLSEYLKRLDEVL